MHFMRFHSGLRVVETLLLSCLLVIPALAAAPEIPPGTEIQVRMIDSLNSGANHPGDIFHGTLDVPIVVKGKEVYPKGADVTGTVVATHPSGRLSDSGEMTLILNTISAGGSATSVNVQPFQVKGGSHLKGTAAKVGGGAALGAIIGAIAGGGKGAAIGAGVGAAAGTGAAAATGKKEAIIDSEAVLTFLTTSAPAIPPSSPESTPKAETAETAPASSPAAATPEPTPQEAPSAANQPGAEQNENSSDNATLFSARDRRVIDNCLQQYAGALPPEALQREDLPSGSERTLHVGATLAPDLQKKVESLPLACEEQLPPLPRDQERVVYRGRVLLLDSSGHILDMFELNPSK
jgi:hypothetical protein